jgi:hypothetical protein
MLTMRQEAIAIMKANPKGPMNTVLELIKRTINRPPLSYYKFIVRNGLAPGENLWDPEVEYLKPNTPSESIALLRRCLGRLRTDTVRQVVRDLSNFDAIGRPASSPEVKRYNRCLSQEAFNLMKKCSTFGQWNELVVNEHSTPVKVMLDWLIDHTSMADDEILQLFKESPLCTITYEEDARLPKSSGWYPERYRAKGIVVTWIAFDPIDHWRRN